jgi:putative (di)nucleoside polyphosphate hydrolase
VFNRAGLVWAGHRVSRSRRDPEGQERWWQMPQGGIDASEAVVPAALRELEEETGIRSARILGVSDGWHRYEFPAGLANMQRGIVYRGQLQRWIAAGFEGSDAEIDIGGRAGVAPEFTQWRWVAIGELPKMVVAFKRKVYTDVLTEFSRYQCWAGQSCPGSHPADHP